MAAMGFRMGTAPAAGMFREFAKRSSFQVTDMFSDGECSKCGGCCGRFLPVTEADLDRLRRLDGTDVEVDLESGMCPFLVGGRCSVYEHRPMICRVYTCRGHKTGELADDPRTMFLNGSAIVDMRRLVMETASEHDGMEM